MGAKLGNRCFTKLAAFVTPGAATQWQGKGAMRAKLSFPGTYYSRDGNNLARKVRCFYLNLTKQPGNYICRAFICQVRYAKNALGLFSDYVNLFEYHFVACNVFNRQDIIFQAVCFGCSHEIMIVAFRSHCIWQSHHHC